MPPLEDCIYIVDELARAGITHVDLTGGEPLLRNDLEKIVRRLSKWGIDIGVIFTNASLLDASVLNMLERYNQHPTFQISFDGVGHHDWLRGVPGAEQQANDAFRLLRERGFERAATMCIHKENKDVLRETVNHLAGLGVGTLRVNAPTSMGIWTEYEERYALSMDELWDIYRDYIPRFFEDGMPINLEIEGFFVCEKGSTKYKVQYVHDARPDSNWNKLGCCESVRYTQHIDPDGRLAPCQGFCETVLRDEFPSVLEGGLGSLTLCGRCYEIVETKISDFLNKNPDCATCEHLPKCCGGCMLAGIDDAGNFLVPDERICYFFKNIGEQAVRDVADAAIAKHVPNASSAPC
ncbi:MAG: radical SAM protein [Atopobiaceae bacterium]|nr:radical SAM protein [Atopobiaceae bacterium]